MGGAIPPPVTPAVTPTTAATATAAPLPVAEATVAKLPERLPELARPVVLTGTVAGQTPEGLTRVRTAAGELLLDSATALPTDKPVTVQITPGTAGAQGASQLPARPTALILLQSLPVTTGAPPPAATPSPAPTPSVILPTPTPPTAAPALPMLTPGTIVPALVLAAATVAKPTPTLASGAPPAAQPVLPGTSVPAPPQGDSAGPSTTPAPAAPSTAPTAAPAPAATPTAPAKPASGTATPAAPSAAPMPNATVELGGDAAHPGADTPTPTPVNPEVPDLPRGATLALKILTVTIPPPPPPPSPTPQPPAKPPGAPDAEPGPKQGQGQAQHQAGTGAQPSAPPALPALNLPGPALPSPAAGEPPPNLPPDTPVLRGTVAGSTPQGQPILATRQGMLALNVAASLPQGATVTAALANLAEATQAATQAAAPTGDAAPMSERDWPAMRQLMAALAAADPALARSMQATMPQPNRKLTAALSFFLSAVRGGDARGWLGEEASAALEKTGRNTLLSQLEKEFESLRREAAEPMPGDWRPYTLPMMDSHGPRPVKLYVHPLKDEEEGAAGKEKGRPGSRFVLDVELSRLGPMQLDGLVRPNHFDLILRSHVALPPELRVELIQVFADSVRAVGFTGGLSFQSGAKSWVKLTRAGRSGLGVSA